MADLEVVHVVVGVALACLLITLCFCCLERITNSYQSQLATREPLLDRDDQISYRVDAVEGEAHEGFRVCPVCTFENFQRSTSCSLCGCLDFASASSNPSCRTARQRRMQKRKQWKRKFDVEGRLYWYRDPLKPAEIISMGSTGHLISFPTSIDQDPKEHAAMDIILPPQCESENGLPFHVIDCATVKDLRECLDSTQAIADHTTPLHEVVQRALLPFPDKYAHFVRETAMLLVPAEIEYLKLSVHRDYVLEESADHLSCVKAKHLHSILRINFLNESGVDAGGLHREWFMLMNDKLTEKDVGLFRCTNRSDNSFYLNPNSQVENGEDHLVYFYAVGRLVGRALLEGTVLNFHFAVPLLKLILDIPITFDDLEYLDEQTFKSLKWILEHDQVDELGLDFSVCEVIETSDGTSVRTVKVVDLIPNGRNVPVTNDNKHDFVKRKFEYMVFESVASQLRVFLKGLHEVIPVRLLVLFDHEELDYILCGSSDIDVNDWRKNTLVSANLKGTRTLRWFWEVVEEMPNDYRSRLLQFATGCSRVPPVGFRGLTSYDGRLCPFSLKGDMDSENQFVNGHACFNRLDIPYYASKDELKQVIYAILDENVYGFNVT